MNKKIVGIYSITNKINDLVYIGSSISCIKSRWGYHLKDLRANKHHSPKLQNAFNKYGEEAFEFNIVEVISDIELVLVREQHYLDTVKPFYNICPTAGNCTGRKASEETKRKMSETGKARELHPALKAQQVSPYPTETETEKYCSKHECFHNKTEFVKNRGNICRAWLNSNRPSRIIPGARRADVLRKAKPIVAKRNSEIIEFESMRDCVRKLSEIYPTINRFGIKLAIEKNRSYYGYEWSYTCRV